MLAAIPAPPPPEDPVTRRWAITAGVLLLVQALFAALVGNVLLALGDEYGERGASTAGVVVIVAGSIVFGAAIGTFRRRRRSRRVGVACAGVLLAIASVSFVVALFDPDAEADAAYALVPIGVNLVAIVGFMRGRSSFLPPAPPSPDASGPSGLTRPDLIAGLTAGVRDELRPSSSRPDASHAGDGRWP